MKFWEPLIWVSLLSASFFALNAAQNQFSAVEALKAQIGQAHQNVGIETPAPKSHQILKLSVLNDGYKSLNPYCMKTSIEMGCLAHLFEGLLYRDAEGKFQGACAETWEYDRQTFTWTFKLRPNLKWNDGSPLTAQDFVRGIRAKFDSESYPHQQIPIKLMPALLKNWSLKGAVELLREEGSLEGLGVWAPNDQTLKLQWTEACNPEICYDQFVAPNCIPLHPQYLQDAQTASKPEDYKSLVTNGPFQLVKLSPGSGMTLKKNPHFWDAKHTLLEELEYIQFQDDMESVLAWQNGKVDISAELESKGLQALLPGDYPFLTSYTDASWIELQFNLNCPKLKDRRVRQAINLLLNRDELETRFFLPSKAALYGHLERESQSELPYSVPSWSLWHQKRRLNEAKRLLSEAGYHSRNKLKLNLAMVRDDDPSFQQGVVTAFRALESYIHLETQNYESLVFSEKNMAREIEVGLRSFFVPSFHPFNKYWRFYHGKTGNLYGFQNADYDKAIEAFKNASTAPEAGAALLTLERILWEEAPVIPLFIRSPYYLVSGKVGGWEKMHRSPISPSGSVMFRFLFKKP